MQSIQDNYGNKDTYQFTNTECGVPGVSPDCSGVTQTATVNYSDGEQDTDVYTDSQLTSATWGGSTSDQETWTYNYQEPTSSNQDGPTTETIGIPSRTATATIETDAPNEVISYTDPNGNTSNWMYNTSTAVSSEGNFVEDLDELCWEAPPGVSTSGAMCSSPPSGATSYSYDGYGNELSKTDALGNTTNYGYYQDGLKCWVSPPTVTTAGTSCSGRGYGGTPNGAPGGATTYEYDNQGDVVNQTVAAAPSPNETATSDFDADDELLYTIPPDGQGQGGFGANAHETAYSYEPDGQVSQEVQPLGLNTTYTYDIVGNALETQDPQGVTVNAYDLDNRLCWNVRVKTPPDPMPQGCTNAPANSTQYLDFAGDTDAPQEVVDPDGNDTLYSYGDSRLPTNPTSVVEPNVPNNPHVVETYSSYDIFGNTCMTGPVSTGSPGTCSKLAGDTTKDYNAEDELTKSYDADGQKTTYVYADDDFQSQPTSLTNPNSGTTNYSYDADGQMTSDVDADGNTVTTGYDADGRTCFVAPVSAPSATCSSPPTGVGKGVSVASYDDASHEISMTDNYGTASPVTDDFSYDASGNTLSTQNDAGQTNTYGYNADNQVTCISYVVTPGSTCLGGSPSGSYVTRSYANGELQSTQDWLGNQIGFGTYNAYGEVGAIVYPSSTGEGVTYSYDADGTPKGMSYTGTKVSGLSGSDTWTPNADEQVGSSSNIGNYTSSEDTYDKYDRVQDTTNPTSTGSEPGADEYQYNANGDLTSDTPPSGSAITYTHNDSDQGDQLTTIDDPNLSTRPYESFGYTADGQECWSKSVNAPVSDSCTSPPSSATQYAWNSYGQLCSVGSGTGAGTCSSSTSTTDTSYKYSGSGLLESSTTNSVSTNYDWDAVTGGSTPLDISDGSNSYIYGALLFGGTAPVEQISSSGQVSFLVSTPSGVQAVFSGGSAPTLEELAAYSAWGQQVIQSGSEFTPFGFDGGYTLSTGLMYFIDRYYDPTIGRFLSVDPLVSKTGEPYAFSGDDPLNTTDPLGLCNGPDGICTNQNTGTMNMNSSDNPSDWAQPGQSPYVQQANWTPPQSPQSQEDAFLQMCSQNMGYCEALQQQQQEQDFLQMCSQNMTYCENLAQANQASAEIPNPPAPTENGTTEVPSQVMSYQSTMQLHKDVNSALITADQSDQHFSKVLGCAAGSLYPLSTTNLSGGYIGAGSGLAVSGGYVFAGAFSGDTIVAGLGGAGFATGGVAIAAAGVGLIGYGAYKLIQEC